MKKKLFFRIHVLYHNYDFYINENFYINFYIIWFIILMSIFKIKFWVKKLVKLLLVHTSPQAGQRSTKMATVTDCAVMFGNQYTFKISNAENLNCLCTEHGVLRRWYNCRRQMAVACILLLLFLFYTKELIYLYLDGANP